MGRMHDRLLQPMYLPNGGDPEQVNLPSLQLPGMLGGRLINVTSQGNKEYQLVQIDSSTTNTPVGTVYDGSMALWVDRDAYKVGTSVSTLGRGNVAGLFTFAATPGNYTMIQVQGRHDSAKLIDSPTAAPSAAGLFVIPSSTDGKVDVLAAGSAATYPTLGRTAGTENLADSTFAVDLDCPEVA